jgi:hypothetical protein
MPKFQDVEVFVMLDENGDYVVADNGDSLDEKYAEEHGETNLARRVVKLNLKIQLPEIVEVSATIPADAAGEVALTVGSST